MKRATGASAHARIGNAAGVGRAARAAHQWADASGVEERRPRYAVRTQRSATRTPARCRATAAARVHSASALRWPGRESTRFTVAGARAGRGCRDAGGVWFSADGSRDVGVCVYVCVCVCMYADGHELAGGRQVLRQADGDASMRISDPDVKIACRRRAAAGRAPRRATICSHGECTPRTAAGDLPPADFRTQR